MQISIQHEVRGRRLGLPSLLATLGVLGTACSENQVVTTTRNLDRPGPMALVCAARVKDAGVTTGLSASSCTSDAGTGATPLPKGTLYGFVANTARGEVAMFRTSTSGEPLLDLDRTSPGFGFIPVGSLPTDLKATRDGCRVISANSGSCDMGIIDVPAALRVAAGEIPGTAAAAVTRVVPRTASGPLRSPPQEILIVPASETDQAPDGVCAATASYRAYVTFPKCNLVAEIDLKTGLIVQGIHITPEGFELTTNPSCPVDCIIRGETERVDAGRLDRGQRDLARRDAGPADSRPADRAPGEFIAADGGADAPGDSAAPADRHTTPDQAAVPDGARSLDGQGDATPPSPQGVMPYAITMDEEGTRLYVSSAGAGFVTVIDVSSQTGALENPRRIGLAGAVHTLRLELSPSTRKLGRFLYAIGSDRTLRVISTDLEQECETQLDLQLIADRAQTKVSEAQVPLSQARCYPVGASDTPARRATATRHGITFGSGVPQDVSFIQSLPGATDAGVPEAGPAATPMQGVFAAVATSDGSTYIIDVEDWSFIQPSSTTVPLLHLPHRFRNIRQGTTAGTPDASVSSVNGAGSGGAPVVVSGVVEGTTLPGEGVFLRAPGEAVASEWNLIYEDQLFQRWAGNLEVTADSLSLTDPGVDFCAQGVLGEQRENGRTLRAGDIVTMVGCKDDTECGLGQTCVKPVAQQADYGLCLEASRSDELFQQCSAYLANPREFVVSRAQDNALYLDVLPLEPQKVILQDPQPSGGCNRNADCQPSFLCALKDQAGSADRALKKGQCFRPGCTRSDNSGSSRPDPSECASGFCRTPLDGSPPVCVAVPAPLEIAQGVPDCKTDADCRPAAGSKLGATCETDGGCKNGPGGDPRLECRKASSEAVSKTCYDRNLFCSRFPGLSGKCVRKSPCFAELQRYQVLAGRSFKVGGYSRISADPSTRECRPDPKKSPLLVDRIPVGIPVYPVIVGPECSGTVPALSLPQPNPCFQLVDQGYQGFTEASGTGSDPPSVGDAPSIQVRYSNPDVWLSLGVSHLASLPSNVVAGDGGVAPAGSFPPMPERGYTITLEVNSGFYPLRPATSSTLSLPSNLVEGPDGYLYVVDMGDRSGSLGTRGQVVRFSRSTAELDTFTVR